MVSTLASPNTSSMFVRWLKIVHSSLYIKQWSVIYIPLTEVYHIDDIFAVLLVGSPTEWAVLMGVTIFGWFFIFFN